MPRCEVSMRDVVDFVENVNQLWACPCCRDKAGGLGISLLCFQARSSWGPQSGTLEPWKALMLARCRSRCTRGGPLDTV